MAHPSLCGVNGLRSISKHGARIAAIIRDGGDISIWRRYFPVAFVLPWRSLEVVVPCAVLRVLRKAVQRQANGAGGCHVSGHDDSLIGRGAGQGAGRGLDGRSSGRCPEK